MPKIAKYFEAEDPRLWGDWWGGTVRLEETMNGLSLRYGIHHAKHTKDRKNGVLITVNTVENPFVVFGRRNMKTGRNVLEYHQLYNDELSAEVGWGLVVAKLTALKQEITALSNLDDYTLIAELKRRGYLIKGKGD